MTMPYTFNYVPGTVRRTCAHTFDGLGLRVTRAHTFDGLGLRVARAHTFDGLGLRVTRAILGFTMIVFVTMGHATFIPRLKIPLNVASHSYSYPTACS